MSISSENKISTLRSDGSVEIAELAAILDVSEADVAESIGLSETCVASSPENLTSEAQQRLTTLVEILEYVIPWAGDPGAAYQWFCDQPIAGFGGKTARQLVKAGRASAVEAYLNRIADGGYA